MHTGRTATNAIPPQASHPVILEDLGCRIATGELQVGTVLTLKDLEQEYAASRTIIREAVRVLESKGLVESRQRVGLTVQPETKWHCLDPTMIRWQLSGENNRNHVMNLVELWVTIEPISARLAAQRARPEQRQRLKQLAETLYDKGTAGEGARYGYQETLTDFHTLILEGTENQMIITLIPSVRQAVAASRRIYTAPRFPSLAILDAHTAIAEAINRGDADSAEEHCRGYTRSILADLEARRSKSV